MPEQIACPSCGATLRVPETLLGKNVKCPKCQNVFRAAAQAPAEPEEPEERVAHEPAPARPSSRRREPPPEDYEEEEGPPPHEDEEEERPRRRRRGSAAAASAVAAPAISLIALACLDYVLIIVGLVMGLAGVQPFPTQGGQGPAAAGGTNIVGQILSTIVGLCCATIILLGAMKMKKLEGFGYAMASSILAMLPCGNCCCFGLPLGIWAIVVLNKPEVKDAFS
jgi:predicted Zn finger-like uncharacterized protein